MTEVERVAAERGTTVVAGMFERSDRHAVQHRRGARWRAAATTARSISTTRSATASPTSLTAGPLEPVTVELGGFTVGADDLLRPALPRAGARAGRPRRRGPAGAGRLGRRPAQGRPLDARCCGRARSRTPCTSSASASPARATPATRWSSDPLGDVLVEGGDGPATLRADLDPASGGRGPPYQPVAGQPAPVTSPRRVQGRSTSSRGRARAGQTCSHDAVAGGDARRAAAETPTGPASTRRSSPSAAVPARRRRVPAADPPTRSRISHRLGVALWLPVVLAAAARWSPRSPAPTDPAG